MADKSTDPAVCGDSRSACIHTNQIVDSCLDKDCVDDLRVYLTTESQAVLNRSTGAKTRCAELLFADVDVDALRYKRGYYAIDITFYYRVLADAIVTGNRPASLYGLAVFSKRAVLCGENSDARIFSSRTRLGDLDGRTVRTSNHPTAVVEVLDPKGQGGLRLPLRHGAGHPDPRKHLHPVR